MDEDNSIDEQTGSLLDRELSRKQFLGVAGAAFLGMFGLLRFTEQVLNGHLEEDEADLAKSTEGVFGERFYGGDAEPQHVHDHKDNVY